MQPAKSFVIFPESTVSTHAFSKTLQNLDRNNNWNKGKHKKNILCRDNTVLKTWIWSNYFKFHAVLSILLKKKMLEHMQKFENLYADSSDATRSYLLLFFLI